MYGYIYKTTNLKNSKVYIGQRKGTFKPEYSGSGLYIKRAVHKNGKENFQVIILKYAISKKEADKLEKKYIKEHRESLGKENVYNIVDGGDGGDTTKQHKVDCGCVACKYRRGELHKSNCRCMSCKNKRSEQHELNCKCAPCRSKRGEASGKNHPFYGKHYIQSKEAKNKIRIDVSGRKWMNNPELKQLKRIKLDLVNNYLKRDWLLGIK